MKTVIEVENLSKSYFLRGNGRNTSLRDVITNTFRSAFASTSQTNRLRETDVLWALSDVTFKVEKGETLGIVGKNGAGKSTLLKILSRITKPTGGTALLRGRVGSLLEVGTGFHQELSGRENIFLSGAILGMKRREIEKKFDEIVAFAEVEKFIETPVKFYSSGMFMRLAFSVAVHLEPEILIVDEVLAVGDTDFQHKCLDKMQQIMNEGRTILFVSHNMSAISRLCSRAIALQNGRIINEGAAQTVINTYLTLGSGMATEKAWKNENEMPQSEAVRLRSVRICNKNGQTVGSVEMQQSIGIEIVYDVLESGQLLIPNFHIFNQERLLLFAIQDVATEWRNRYRERGRYTTTAWLPGNFFNQGRIIVEIAISSHLPKTKVHLRTDEIVSFEVVENPSENVTRGDFAGSIPGVMRPAADWETEVQNFQLV